MSYAVSPLGSKAITDRPTKIQSMWMRMRDQWAPFRARQIKNYEYVIGNQIDEDVRAELRRGNRPALVWNLVQPKIVAIAGLLEKNKAYLRAIPVNEGDELKAEMHTQLVSDWAMRQPDGLREITKAAIDAAIGGIGWINNTWSTRRSPLGHNSTQSYDPFMIMFEVDTRQQSLDDCHYLSVSGFYTGDEIIGIYSQYLDDATITEIQERDVMLSGLKQEGRPVSWAERVWSGVSDFFNQSSEGKSRSDDYASHTVNEMVDTRTGRYRVIEMHDRRTIVKTVLYNPSTRQTVEIPLTDDPTKSRAAAEQTLAQLGQGWVKRTINTEEIWITAVCPTLLPNRELCEVPHPVQGKGFQFKPIFAYDFHPDITKMVSLIDILIDPQDSYNQRRMSFLEWIMDAVNPDIVVPQGGIQPQDLEAWTSGKRGVLKFFRPISGLAPEPQHPLSEAQALKVFADEDLGLAEQLTGITPSVQGREESAGETGVLFAQKVQNALTALSKFFGNVMFAQKDVFNFVDRQLQVNMDMPRKIRLLNKDNDPYWLQVNMPTLQGVDNDVTEGEFDWEADVAQLGETAKQVKLMEMLAIIKMVPPELTKWDEVFKLMDSPAAKPMAEFASTMMGIALQAQQQQAKLANATAGAQAVSALNGAAADPVADAGMNAQMAAAQPQSAEVGG